MRNEYVAGYALGVRMKEWKAIRKSARARKILHVDPYIHMYTMMMVLITGDLEDEHLAGRISTREGVAFLCDEHDKGIKIKNAYDDLKRFNPSCAPWMGSLSYNDNEQSPALQAADLLAARCKDGLVEEATKGLNKQQLGEMLRSRLGDSVSFRVFDTLSLKMLVDANLLRNRKPSIGSTQQLSMFKDLFVSKNSRKEK